MATAPSVPPGHDVGGHREARPDRVRRVFDADLDLEVDRLGVRGQREQIRIILRNRRRPDLGDQAVELAVGIGVDRDFRPLADLDLGHRRLVHHHHRLDLSHVGDRQKLGAGVVHRPDDGDLALLDRKSRHDAVDGRRDRRLGERVAASGQVGDRFVHALLGRFERRLRRVERRLGLLVLGLREDVGVEVSLRALVVALGLLGGGPGGVEVVAHGGEARLAALRRGRQLRLVDLQEQLPAADVIAFLDRQVDDLPHDERREVHLPAGLDLPVGRDLGHQVDFLDLRGGDAGEVAVPSRSEEKARIAPSPRTTATPMMILVFFDIDPPESPNKLRIDSYFYGARGGKFAPSDARPPAPSDRRKGDKWCAQEDLNPQPPDP